jgi:outer membrane protein OmpA-like peptidoglycan-associated protein
MLAMTPAIRRASSRVLDQRNRPFEQPMSKPDRNLAGIAAGLKLAIGHNAQVFLIEGHTDAVGSNLGNFSLSDRRAESVAPS